MITTSFSARAARGLALCLFLGNAALASASVTLSYQFITPELPAGTRCLLVASTQDSGFGQAGDLAGVPLVAGSTVGQDNVVLAVLTAENLPGSVTGVSGALTIEYTGQLNAGDPLRLFWLPGLDPAATVLPLGSGFVDFGAELPADGGTIGYALPADGSTQNVHSISPAYGGATLFPGSVPATIATYPAGQNTDGDAFDDLTEFAMGLNIYQNSTPQQPTLAYANGGANLRFEFGHRDDLALHALTMEVESSLTIQTGSWFPVPIQPSLVAGRWEVIVPTPSGANARQFFRIKVIASP